MIDAGHRDCQNSLQATCPSSQVNSLVVSCKSPTRVPILTNYFNDGHNLHALAMMHDVNQESLDDGSPGLR